MGLIWKGPGALWGKGDPVLAGKPIPEGHVLPVRLKELAGRIEKAKPKTEPAPGLTRQPAEEKPAEKPEETADEKPAETPEDPKRGPGRPPGSKNK